MLLVRMQYKNADYGANIISERTGDVAPSMVCEDLAKIPEIGEIVYLGTSGKHFFPSDVIVAKCDDSKVIEDINFAYEGDIEEVAKRNGDKIDDSIYSGESELRNEYAGKIADAYLGSI